MRLRHPRAVLVLLALLTIFVQQGAWWHALSHATESSRTEQGDGHGLPPAHVCEECVAYAAVGAALPSLGVPGAAAQELPPPPDTPSVPILPSAADPYRARGPPATV